MDARVSDPFKHGAELREAQERQTRVEAGLTAMATEQNLRSEATDVPGVGSAAAARDRIKELAARARANVVDDQTDVNPSASVGPISNQPRGKA